MKIRGVGVCVCSESLLWEQDRGAGEDTSSSAVLFPLQYNGFKVETNISILQQYIALHSPATVKLSWAV